MSGSEGQDRPGPWSKAQQPGPDLEFVLSLLTLEMARLWPRRGQRRGPFGRGAGSPLPGRWFHGWHLRRAQQGLLCCRVGATAFLAQPSTQQQTSAEHLLEARHVPCITSFNPHTTRAAVTAFPSCRWGNRLTDAQHLPRSAPLARCRVRTRTQLSDSIQHACLSTTHLTPAGTKVHYRPPPSHPTTHLPAPTRPDTDALPPIWARRQTNFPGPRTRTGYIRPKAK